MKSLIKNIILTSVLVFSFWSVKAQLNSAAPMNVTALHYKTRHYDLVGPVKKAGDMEFDKKGNLIKKMDDGLHIFSYTKTEIIVKRDGYEYHYQLNKKNQVVAWTLKGEKDNGHYAYDEHGNLLEENSISEDYEIRRTYTYDDKNRMISSTDWYDNEPYVTNYSYNGTPNDLQIKVTESHVQFMETTYYYKNGILQSYKSLGANMWENVSRDSYGNWLKFDHTLLGTTSERTITYY